MKINVTAMAATSGLLWGGAVLAVAVVNLAKPTYGRRFLRMMGSIYPGYHAIRSAKDIVTGAGYAALDGAIGGAVFASLYNQFESRTGRRKGFLRAA